LPTLSRFHDAAPLWPALSKTLPDIANFSPAFDKVDDKGCDKGFKSWRSQQFRLEMAAIGLILLLLNWPLLHGACNSAMIFLPSPVRQGEWWRLLTHPFVHVTWFHLLLDGAAFFLLYNDLAEHHWTKRFGWVFASAALLAIIWLRTT